MMRRDSFIEHKFVTSASEAPIKDRSATRLSNFEEAPSGSAALSMRAEAKAILRNISVS
jgi:hypothetical protein